MTPMATLSLKLRPLFERVDQLSLRERARTVTGSISNACQAT